MTLRRSMFSGRHSTPVRDCTLESPVIWPPSIVKAAEPRVQNGGFSRECLRQMVGAAEVGPVFIPVVERLTYVRMIEAAGRGASVQDQLGRVLHTT